MTFAGRVTEVAKAPLAVVAQRLVDAIAQTQGDGRVQRMRLTALLRARRMLLATGDPLVRYRLHEVELSLPLSHSLPLFRRSYPGYSENLGVAARVVANAVDALKIIDVGANVGDSVAIFRAHCSAPILCVEGDPGYAALLRANTASLDDVEIAQALVGAPTSSTTHHLQRDRGTARLTAGNSADPAGPAGPAGIVTLDQLLNQQTQFRKAKLLKVDTDGWDYDVLLGASQLLAAAQPVLFVEYDPRLCDRTPGRGFELFSYLAEHGYAHAVAFDNLGDYLLSARLDQHELLEDLHRRALGDSPPSYLDLCLFHQRDAQLAQQLRRACMAMHSNSGLSG